MPKQTGNLENQLVKQKAHHRKAFEYISMALKIDEENEGNKKQAIQLYEKGIIELEKGILVDCSGHKGEAGERAQRLQDKMRTNLKMAKERLKFLVSNNSPVNAHRRSNSLTMPNRKYSMKSHSPVNTPGSYGKVPSSYTPPALKKQSSAPSASPGHKGQALSKSKSSDTVKTPVLKGVEQSLVKRIMDEVLEESPSVKWEDIAGQEVAKQALREIVILPAQHPELFTGLRTPARGLLLFGPPGNGKTLLARGVATACDMTFFNISAASVTSKYVGESEKLVRALFALARKLQPSIIFVDEVDSFLTKRGNDESEASRRLKTEFLIEFDGVSSNPEHRLLVMAATNRPYELDDAVLRRFSKRIYVALPDHDMRKGLLKRLLDNNNCRLSPEELDKIAALTEGYSGSDLTNLAKDAALGPIRDLKLEQTNKPGTLKVRDITFQDFQDSLKRIRRSVPPSTVEIYDKWNAEFGDITC
ncbi:spastin isoform X2 [Planococcus citri]